MIATSIPIQLVRQVPLASREHGYQCGTTAQGPGGHPKFFAMTQQNAEESNIVVITILTVCFHGSYTLIDLGLTYSYVSPYFALFLDRAVKTLDNTFLVLTLVNESITVDQVYGDCIVSVQGRDTMVDLFLLSMMEFDVIIGID